ncbi:glyoxalase [Psychroflexus planctonicus]|uniref:Glyoxalase n=1 Tax=Psychroflexus planctonicus TaxID=1526575 RepID=A0ABQ1SEE4_9FLAO|nr:glyoxalase [Psychroflexus planctonicus]GGE27122.1 hypothetical protein GCM10010832_04830 [Psychroflexus planctonicus]
MENREKSLLELRPVIRNAKVNSDTLSAEAFQNKTLRPIAKFQNDLLIEMFKVYINYRKNKFYELSLENKLKYIEEAVKKDAKLRRQVQGVFIGLFSIEEYMEYSKDYKSFNKRINNLCIERLKSNIQLFEKV